MDAGESNVYTMRNEELWKFEIIIITSEAK